MSKITLQDIVKRVGTHVPNFEKKMVQGEGAHPLMLLSSGAFAAVEMLSERGALKEDPSDIMDERSAVTMMETAKLDDEHINSGAYSVSIEQYMKDVYAKYPHMRYLAEATPCFELMMVAAYTAAASHMEDSGLAKPGREKAVVAQVARFTLEATKLHDKVGKDHDEREWLKQQYKAP